MWVARWNLQSAIILTKVAFIKITSAGKNDSFEGRLCANPTNDTDNGAYVDKYAVENDEETVTVIKRTPIQEDDWIDRVTDVVTCYFLNNEPEVRAVEEEAHADGEAESSKKDCADQSYRRQDVSSVKSDSFEVSTWIIPVGDLDNDAKSTAPSVARGMVKQEEDWLDQMTDIATCGLLSD